MRECDKLFKRYCNESNPTLHVAKHNKYKNAQTLVIFKVKQTKKEYHHNYFQKHSKNVNKINRNIEIKRKNSSEFV